MSKINVPEDETDKFADLIAGLLRKGIRYSAELTGGYWQVTITSPDGTN